MSEARHALGSRNPGTPLDALASNSFCRVADAQQFDGNAVRLLCDGGENYPAWLAAIARARHNVNLENYLFWDDEIGRAFSDALADAARRGVACRVIYDWLGCVGKTSGRFWRKMRAAGVEVRCYNPPRIDNPLMWVSRDHRKVLCVDNQLAFTGGLCIGSNWIGHPDRGIPAWRDTAMEIRGPAAAHLSQAFADSWLSAGSALPANELTPPEETAAQGDVRLWVVAGHPDSMGLYRLEQLVAEIVERSLWLADAYFVATTAYVRALTTAAQAGVDVRLLVPSSGDVPLVGAISRSAYRPLLEGGVRIFEWNGPMMHAKTAVADGCWSRVGSSNSNFASWITNRELDITVHDRSLAADMEALYLRDLDNTTEVVLRHGRPRPTPQPGSHEARYLGKRAGTASRLLAGVIGFGGTVGATLARHRVLGASEVRNIAFAGIGLLLFAAAALTRPWLIAYPLGAIAVWVATSLLVGACRLHFEKPPNDKPEHK
ncbi:phospholipase D-like domain-containing protein [Telmatospirillum siberiense]|uniref:phospholipase D-like domain-containing protein n=1 Tax=Telmatospirillum siberiense TaxID=382514 RepID=UPI0018EA5C03|nr:phospholipase D-like domain-containing protein [Telmatospirillum siberiense]